jgi:midasin
VAEGTGLGEGDTQGAKDISDQLEDQDQLLGAAEKDQQDPNSQDPSGKSEKGAPVWLLL